MKRSARMAVDNHQTRAPWRLIAFMASLLVAAPLSAGPRPLNSLPREPEIVGGGRLLVELVDQLEAGGDIELFRAQIVRWYDESSARRLLHSADPRVREAAIFAIGVVGTMDSNNDVGDALRDRDPHVRMLASQVCWTIWFRGGTPEQSRRLRRILSKSPGRSPVDVRDDLDRLIAEAPNFAEAINQRAVISFQLGQWDRAASDCQRTLELNPRHFGALEGLGLCQKAMNEPAKALATFEKAMRLRPDAALEHTIAELRRQIQR